MAALTNRDEIVPKPATAEAAEAAIAVSPDPGIKPENVTSATYNTDSLPKPEPDAPIAPEKGKLTRKEVAAAKNKKQETKQTATKSPVQEVEALKQEVETIKSDTERNAAPKAGGIYLPENAATSELLVNNEPKILSAETGIAESLNSAKLAEKAKNEATEAENLKNNAATLSKSDTVGGLVSDANNASLKTAEAVATKANSGLDNNTARIESKTAGAKINSENNTNKASNEADNAYQKLLAEYKSQYENLDAEGQAYFDEIIRKDGLAEKTLRTSFESSSDDIKNTVTGPKKIPTWLAATTGALNGLSKMRMTTNAFGLPEFSVDNSETAIDKYASKVFDSRERANASIDELSSSLYQDLQKTRNSTLSELNKLFKEKGINAYNKIPEVAENRITNSLIPYAKLDIEQKNEYDKNNIQYYMDLGLKDKDAAIEANRQTIDIQNKVLDSSLDLATQEELIKWSNTTMYKDINDWVELNKSKFDPEKYAQYQFDIKSGHLTKIIDDLSDIKLTNIGGSIGTILKAFMKMIADGKLKLKEGGPVDSDNSNNADVPDSVPALLAPGEFVVSNKDVRKIRRGMGDEVLKKIAKSYPHDEKGAGGKAKANSVPLGGSNANISSPDTASNIVGGVASGASTGAGIGSFAGPIGTAIGAGIGAIGGAIGGDALTKDQQRAHDRAVADNQTAQLTQLQNMGRK